MSGTAKMTPYRSFGELARREPKEGTYRIEYRRGTSGIAVMAIHGGGIEPGTTEIAEAIAGRDHSFYSFTGIKSGGNWQLHVSSRCFDEPVGLYMAETARLVVTIHGCKGNRAAVYLGGRHLLLKKSISEALKAAEFSAGGNPQFPGETLQNICNRGRLKRGVQLELTRALRNAFFFDLSYACGRSRQKPPFARFVSAVRSILAAER